MSHVRLRRAARAACGGGACLECTATWVHFRLHNYKCGVSKSGVRHAYTSTAPLPSLLYPAKELKTVRLLSPRMVGVS